jgi:Tol biopolymer transport system component
MRISQDGKTSLCVRDLEKGQDRAIPFDLRFLYPQWSLDGKEIFVKGQDWQNRMRMYRVAFESLDVAPILELGGSDIDVIISPNGKELFLVRWEGMSVNRILARNLGNGSEKELLRQQGTQPLSLALSPDGRWLALVNRESDRHLEIIPAAGGEPRTLCTWSQSGGHPSDPFWTKDGRNILISRNMKRELWSISIDGGEPQKLGTSDSRIDEPDIHPGGHQIVFSSMTRGGSSGIWVMENFLPKNAPVKKQREQ